MVHFAVEMVFAMEMVTANVMVISQEMIVPLRLHHLQPILLVSTMVNIATLRVYV